MRWLWVHAHLFYLRAETRLIMEKAHGRYIVAFAESKGHAAWRLFAYAHGRILVGGVQVSSAVETSFPPCRLYECTDAWREDVGFYLLRLHHLFQG